MQTFIRSPLDLETHLDALCLADSRFTSIREEAGDIPIRWLDPGFQGLVWVVTGQQISVAAGRAIYSRLEALIEEITPETLAAVTDAALRAVGYSGAKVRTLRALQDASLCGRLDLDALQKARAPEAISTLCAVKGIGPWTAEVYLLFAAGHSDIFPAGDVALQEAARLAFDLEERPDAKTFRTMAEGWAPWRSAAARLLWGYYRVRKNGQAVTPV